MRRNLTVILISVIIICTLGLYYIADNSYASIKVLDSASKEYVNEPTISMFPDITPVGQPGTGGAGPFLYSPIVPIPVVVTVSASGYREQSEIVLLMKGRESIIFMSRE